LNRSLYLCRSPDRAEQFGEHFLEHATPSATLQPFPALVRSTCSPSSTRLAEPSLFISRDTAWDRYMTCSSTCLLECTDGSSVISTFTLSHGHFLLALSSVVDHVTALHLTGRWPPTGSRHSKCVENERIACIPIPFRAVKTRSPAKSRK
jgi:hypothetical protein